MNEREAIIEAVRLLSRGIMAEMSKDDAGDYHVREIKPEFPVNCKPSTATH